MGPERRRARDRTVGYERTSDRPPGPRPVEEATLHQQVGNVAFGQLLRLQRDDQPGGGGPVSLRMRPPPSLLPGPGLLLPRPVPDDVRAGIEAWLDRRRIGISMQVDAGTISLPELVAQIREEVTGAARVEVFQIEDLVRRRLGAYTPPPQRGRQTPAGQASELAARLRNILGMQVRVGSDAANLVVSISGAVATARAGGVEARAEAGPGGVSGTLGTGRVTATASPDSFGLRATIPLAGAEGVFAARLARDGDTWSRWSVSLSFPVVGRRPIDARPAAEAIASSVTAAEGAIRDIAAHLHGGGSPTDSYVRERAGRISPAISRVSSAVQRRDGPNVTVRLGAEGGPSQVAGERVQAATAGVSLVIEF
ncbi:MAG: hypothetical protein KY462_14600 [Actinobacteria bacterium]|nr:hypothetical protein [Actinomycetota bacterium]